ncbi:MAG: CDP-alcohol phosphatidyltransferase family protein [Deltaproteobacteria bacterium]|nr:CDP-alcohol phosphatidyltransferase family protein [Deltaproteobacteria bacterium]
MTARERLLKIYYLLMERLFGPLARPSVSPNTISLVSLAASFAACILYARGTFFAGGLVLLLSGFLDTLDGTIARLAGRSTRFGALLDSVLDRYADFFVFAGLMVYYRYHWMFFVIILAILGSFMVSYVKARAESLGELPVVGLMQRPERLLLIVAGSFLTVPASWHDPRWEECPVIAVLCLLSVLTNTTALHRLLAARQELSRQEERGETTGVRPRAGRDGGS